MSNNNFENKVWNIPLADIMSDSFGKYAKYIIQDRALPDIRDGLKPVQRRILYAMHDLKIYHDKAYKKSARTVGEVIGKYHPHGDISIYEAMVRMSQEWKNNIPLLDMQGNKGSLDGDSAAAMRYTECRLSLFGEQLLNDIEKETVKFIPNFDDSENEPSVLPSLLPNVLVNGATGIAAGYATNIPPFNLNEVLDGTIYRINNPNCTLKDISKIIKGPDFPMGGIIQGKDGILEMFATGQGKFSIQAKINEVVRGQNSKKQLIITELPYETNKANIIKSIDELRINNELPGLKEVRDDSDKNGICIVLEFNTEKDLDKIKSFLLKKTQLQISYSANIILIKDRKPHLCGLIDIIDSYISHMNDIIIKSSSYDLKKALNRKEILEGLIKAISDIDNLVRLIKSSTSKEEAKNKLINFFELTEKQAEAVVQLRLYVLTSYDTKKLIDEYKELLNFIDIKEKLINDVEFRNTHIISKLEDFKRVLGYRRRSQIEDEIQSFDVNTTDIIEEKNGVCIVTRDSYIKFIDDKSLNEIDLSKMKIKDGDIPIEFFQMSTLDDLVLLTNSGKCITIPSHKIKMTKLRENGIHVNEIVTIDSQDRIVAAFAISKTSNISTEILVATKHSLIKRFTIDGISLSKNAKTSTYISLKNNDEVVSAFILHKNNKEIITFTESGYAIRYAKSEVPIVGRTAQGVKNINLKNNDSVACVLPIDDEESFILLVSNRGGKRIHYEDVPVSGRSTIGKRVLMQVDSNPYKIHSGFMVGGRQTIILLNDIGKLVETRVSDIPITDGQTRMNSFSSIDGSITKASWLKLNKNYINDHETNNFLSLDSFKQNEKSSSNETKTSGINERLNDLLNTPIKQKEVITNYEKINYDKNNILELIDENKLINKNSNSDNLLGKQEFNNESNWTPNNNKSNIEINNDFDNKDNNKINETKSIDELENESKEIDETKSIDILDNKTQEIEEETNISIEINENSKEYLNNEFDNDNYASNIENKIDIVETKEDELIDTYEIVDDKQSNILETKSIIESLKENNNNLSISLIKEGYDVNELDLENKSPLIIASINNNIDVISELIKHNANINIQDNNGNTALIYAVKNNNIEIIDLLINNNANLDIENNDGFSAIDIAMLEIKNENIGAKLVENGANPKNYFDVVYEDEESKNSFDDLENSLFNIDNLDDENENNE